ncbi:MAG: BRO family protein [Acinetobacter sp.]
MNALTTFSFESASPVRIININEEPWFVAKDVAEALDYKWNGSKTVGHVPEQWRSTAKIKGVESDSTPQEMLILAEHGLYFFLNRSDKPKAIPFQMKVAEIITTIRKTGKYEAPKYVEKRDFLTANDMNGIKRLIWLCSHRMRYTDATNQGIWHALRQATNVPSPERFEVKHLPILAYEFQRIFSILQPYVDARRECEQTLIKRLIRNSEDNHPVLNLLLEDMKKSTEEFSEIKSQYLQTSFLAECKELIARTKGERDYPECDEQFKLAFGS